MSEPDQLAGQEPDFTTMSWSDLLRRFSEARFKVLQYQENNGTDEEDEGQQDECPEKASDILLPPLTAAEIAIAEAKLGPIPQDLKDMSLVARGFKGGWHFAGGGFPGLQDVFEGALENGAEYLEYFDAYDEGDDEGDEQDEPSETKEEVDIEDDDEKSETEQTGNKRKFEYPNCWAYSGTMENDDVEHFICPPAAWAKFRKSAGKPKPKSNEYGIWSGAHWSEEPLHGLSLTMRGYIVRLLKEMEEQLAGKVANNEGEGEDQGDDDEEEEEEESKNHQNKDDLEDQDEDNEDDGAEE